MQFLAGDSASHGIEAGDVMMPRPRLVTAFVRRPGAWCGWKHPLTPDRASFRQGRTSGAIST
jgi:hypothetical protein